MGYQGEITNHSCSISITHVIFRTYLYIKKVFVACLKYTSKCVPLFYLPALLRGRKELGRQEARCTVRFSPLRSPRSWPRLVTNGAKAGARLRTPMVGCSGWGGWARPGATVSHSLAGLPPPLCQVPAASHKPPSRRGPSCSASPSTVPILMLRPCSSPRPGAKTSAHMGGIRTA